MLMRINLLPFCATALSLVFFCSCQKELSPDASAPVNTFTTTADSNYLSKQTFVQRHPVAIDTGATYYHFDSQKRVISISFRDLGSTNLPVRHDTTNYFYHGNDTLPYKEIYVDIFPSESDSTERYMTYNSVGKLVNDSIIYSSGFGSNYNRVKQIGKYTYNGNKIFRESHETILFDPGGVVGLIDTQDTVTLDSRGNALTLHEIQYDAPGSIYSDYLNTFTYDQNPSPYLKLNINNIFPVVFGGDYEYEQIGSRNNRIYWREEIAGGTPGGNVNFDAAGDYSYFPSGFPVMMLNPDINPGEYEKFLYEYRVL